jgi:single-strand DNA-binding protein
MASLNKVELIGNLGQDPEVRNLPSGGKVVNLSIATSESWKDKNSGERKERTEWHRVVIFSEGLGKVAEQYLHKGSKVYLEGQLQTRKWTDKDDVERYSTEVVLQGFGAKLIMLDGRRDGEGDNGGSRQQERRSDPPSSRPGANRTQAPASKPFDDQDDIPF